MTSLYQFRPWKDWVNGISPHGPDEEGIGSTIIIFYHKINVVLLKKKLGSNVDSEEDVPTVMTATRISVVESA